MRKTPFIATAVLVLSFTVIAIGDSRYPALLFLAKLGVLCTVLVVVVSWLLTRYFSVDTNRKFWLALASISVSVGISLLAAEFVARVAYKDISTTGDNSSFFARRWYQLHPPDINDLGFRERNIGETDTKDSYRIAVVGDSFTYGQGLLAEQRFTNLLQLRLKDDRGANYDVLNFGRPGAETDDHLEILNQFVLDLSPDFVILQWYVNDVELIKEDRPTPLDLIPSAFLRRWLHTRSALYYLVNAQWASFQSTMGITESRIENMNRRFKDPNNNESRAASAALEELLDRLEQRNIPAGMVLFPMMVDVSGDVEAYPLGFLMDRVLRTCDTRGVPCLDLRPAFASQLSGSELWANRLDRHPGPAANLVASEAILEYFGRAWGHADNVTPR